MKLIIKMVDDFLNQITMYRLVLYYLLVLVVISAGLALFGLLPFGPVELLLSIILIVAFSWISNEIFARVYKAPTNVESVYITALILGLIIDPARSISDGWFLVFAAILATASKYILAVNKKHIFNPVAIAVVITALGAGQTASWWVGNVWLAPFTILGCILITRKIRREDMVESFLLTTLTISLGLATTKGSNLLITLNNVVFHSSIWFLAGVMLTEPLTAPATKYWQIVYGALVGLLFVPQVHIGDLYFSPEEALAAGNLLAFAVNPKYKLILNLGEKVKTSEDTYDFIFPLRKKLKYIPGQYMEWTLAGSHSDDRGNRRYFTLASSPTEDNVRIGVKFYDNSSSFKKEMIQMENEPIVASSLAGDFVLPKNKKKKIVLIAGGIGITPFRSMIKYLVDKNEKRDIVLLYSNRCADEIIYTDVFGEAARKIGARTIYTLTDTEKAPVGWPGEKGRISPDMIKINIPDWEERVFYVSGPQAMVTGIKEMLTKMGLPKEQIKTDYFPGFA